MASRLPLHDDDIAGAPHASKSNAVTSRLAWTIVVFEWLQNAPPYAVSPACAHQIAVGLLDDVAQVNADSNLNALLVRHTSVAPVSYTHLTLPTILRV